MAPAIPIELPQLDEIRTMLEAVLEGRPRQEWFTLEQAWRLKYAALMPEGAISYQTVRATRALQPCGGRPDGWASGKKIWKDATVQEWLAVCDDDLEEYLKKYGSGSPIPIRIHEAVKRRRAS
jgi:hypothetical protein